VIFDPYFEGNIHSDLLSQKNKYCQVSNTDGNVSLFKAKTTDEVGGGVWGLGPTPILNQQCW